MTTHQSNKIHNKLEQYVSGIFAPYDGIKMASDLKANLLIDLQERFDELKKEGNDDDQAYSLTIASIGEIEETLKELTDQENSPEQGLVINFSGSDLVGSDFENVSAHKGVFYGSAMSRASFANSDLTGSSFKGSDLIGINFDHANLTDCSFTACALNGASFNKTILIRTKIFASDLADATLKGAKFTDAKFVVSDLTKTIFENCTFNNVQFEKSDLQGVSLDKQVFINVRFGDSSLKNTSFKGATLKNVSFTPPFAFTKKYISALKTINFDGAFIDKLSYNSLKGLGANVANVNIV
jgi:uncharacterized protein YjbI with pentapeptide repeats